MLTDATRNGSQHPTLFNKFLTAKNPWLLFSAQIGYKIPFQLKEKVYAAAHDFVERCITADYCS